jgi:CO/xanthine dehydrogenase FAD-binding subunit
LIGSEIAGGDSGGSGQALFAAGGCVGMSPSDTAPALVALDAKMVIKGSKGERSTGAEDQSLPALTAFFSRTFKDLQWLAFS